MQSSVAARALSLSGGGIPPFQPAPRFHRGNFCGVRVPGLPFIEGGSADTELVYMPFYPRYSDGDRAKIRQAYGQIRPGSTEPLTHVWLSASDAAVWGIGPIEFLGACVEWRQAGFFPGVNLRSKIYPNVPVQNVPEQLALLEPYISTLLASDPIVVTWVLIGMELNIGLSPEDVQALIDAWAPRFVARGIPVYVHFGPGIFAWQPNGQPTAAFWNANVGKLTGLQYQRNLDEDVAFYYERIKDDCLPRFAGFDGFSPDSGFGHPFDFVAGETTATLQFNQQMTEAEGTKIDQGAVAIPPVTGPTGVQVQVMGAGNGL